MESLVPQRLHGQFLQCKTIISQPLALQFASEINMYQHVLVSGVPPSTQFKHDAATFPCKVWHFWHAACPNSTLNTWPHLAHQFQTLCGNVYRYNIAFLAALISQPKN